MKIEKFNDVLAVLLVGLIVLLWGLDGWGVITLPDVVLGATIPIMSAVVTYYFRKRPGDISEK